MTDPEADTRGVDKRSELRRWADNTLEAVARIDAKDNDKPCEGHDFVEWQGGVECHNCPTKWVVGDLFHAEVAKRREAERELREIRESHAAIEHDKRDACGWQRTEDFCDDCDCGADLFAAALDREGEDG